MRATTSIRAAFWITVTTFALASAAHATATRTYVSSAGLDSNASSNCPRTTPCKTFAGAYAVTQSGGEIVALDAAAYGPLTITGPLSIIAIEGAIITVQSSTVGITISTGSATDVVILRNLQISGAAGSSLTKGIVVNPGSHPGRLILENSTLKSLTSALEVNSSKVDIDDTDIIGNATGITTTGAGVDTSVFPLTGGTTVVRLSGGHILDNGTAFSMSNPGLSGSGSGANFITIFGLNQGGSITTIMAGNATFVTGSGASCMAVNNCQAISDWSSSKTGNFN
jgi:hypothetical protein